MSASEGRHLWAASEPISTSTVQQWDEGGRPGPRQGRQSPEDTAHPATCQSPRGWSCWDVPKGPGLPGHQLDVCLLSVFTFPKSLNFSLKGTDPCGHDNCFVLRPLVGRTHASSLPVALAFAQDTHFGPCLLWDWATSLAFLWTQLNQTIWKTWPSGQNHSH